MARYHHSDGMILPGRGASWGLYYGAYDTVIYIRKSVYQTLVFYDSPHWYIKWVQATSGQVRKHTL